MFNILRDLYSSYLLGGRGGGFNNSGNGSSNYYGSGSRGGGTSYGGNQVGNSSLKHHHNKNLPCISSFVKIEKRVPPYQKEDDCTTKNFKDK